MTRRPGRPPGSARPAEEVRHKRLVCQVVPAELDTINDQARAAGLTVSDYIRERLGLPTVQPRRPSPADAGAEGD